MLDRERGGRLVRGREFGQDLFDAISQASSGLMSMTGVPDGKPTLSGTCIADCTTGYQGAIGALPAFLHRERTGEGQLVDVASFDTMFSALGVRLMAQLMLGAAALAFLGSGLDTDLDAVRDRLVGTPRTRPARHRPRGALRAAPPPPAGAARRGGLRVRRRSPTGVRGLRVPRRPLTGARPVRHRAPPSASSMISSARMLSAGSTGNGPPSRSAAASSR
ncbi:CoA transferase [Streptomyces sp. NPDC059255]|uniref:CoA transferase n=1 Tax=Streptomyces sp. NPDC059255 TaxID=3346793 RepID=UPI00368E43FB